MGILNHHAIDNDGVDIYTSDYLLRYNSDSFSDPYNITFKSINDGEMDYLLEIFSLGSWWWYLGVGLQILQDCLVVSPSSILYTVSALFFRKCVGSNFWVIDYMSHFYMLVPTKSKVKLYNGNMRHAQLIGIILFIFPNCPIIFPVRPDYYFPCNSYNNI